MINIQSFEKQEDKLIVHYTPLSDTDEDWWMHIKPGDAITYDKYNGKHLKVLYSEKDHLELELPDESFNWDYLQEGMKWFKVRK